VNDGNIVGIPVTAQDVRRAFDIYGKPVAHVRGRRTAHKATKEVRDIKLRDSQHVPQSMYGDIMHMRGKQYLMCLSVPLGLSTVNLVKSLSAESLGLAILEHVKTLQNRGFYPAILYLDAQSGFATLNTNIPGIEIDIAGAGDHNNPVDLLI